MWPWEHLAFGYLCYSLFTRLQFGRGPQRGPAIALAVATQFPDLLDKPLAWSVDVLPTARSLGHSAFFAIGVVGLVAVVAWWVDRPAYLPAVAIGYVSHLLGDVLYALIWTGTVAPRYLLWPLLSVSPRETSGLLVHTATLLAKFLDVAGTPMGRTYLTIEAGLLLLVILLWRTDGWPGLRSPN